jgi:N-acetylglutamate synthase-like GNAT family acetyltransferase
VEEKKKKPPQSVLNDTFFKLKIYFTVKGEHTFMIRSAVPKDKLCLKEIIDLSFRRFYRYFSSRSVNSKTGTVLVYEENGIVAGFARLTEFTVGGIKFGCVLWLAVHPDWRRRGVAAGLVKAGAEWLLGRGVRAVFASAGHGNVGSISAFLGAGFRRMGFLGLWRFFGWGVFGFYGGIWFVPGEVVLMYG